MSFWDITGNVERTLINGQPSGIDNDQGTIRYGGNIADTDKWTAFDLGDVNRVITIISGVNGISGILPLGVFNGGDQVIRRVTTDIAGVGNSGMLYAASNAANSSDSIHQTSIISTFFYKQAIRANHWSQVSGVFEAGFPEVANSGGYDNTTDTDEAADLKANVTDNAANPSGAIPGEFVYRNGSPLPVQANYAAKTVF